MRSDDYGFARLSCACNSIPQKPSGYRVHPSWRFIQEDDRRPTNQSHPCTQLPLVTTTACVDGDILFTQTKHGICDTKHLTKAPAYQPVTPDQLVSMRLQQQRPEHILHTARHVLFWYSSEPGIHTQSFSSCHVVQCGIKLRTVTNALLHLQCRHTVY